MLVDAVIKRVSLKVDVDTYRGTLEGVPRLLRLFDKYRVRATFLFSLGPDHTGRALRRVFRPGFLQKVGRTSVASHYGWKTLLYGTLLPGPHIGRKAQAEMRAVSAAGHEVGIHCYDHVRWQDFVAQKDEDWTRQELERAMNAFVDVFERPAEVHGAAGWQLNQHVIALEEKLGFRYASDSRGQSPFYPVIGNRESRCIQLPTTLPTLDELVGRDSVSEANVQDKVIGMMRHSTLSNHVYTLHAELEGMRLMPIMDNLLDAWTEMNYQIGAMEEAFDALDTAVIPRHQIAFEQVPGRIGTLAVQGAVVSCAPATEATHA